MTRLAVEVGGEGEAWDALSDLAHHQIVASGLSPSPSAAKGTTSTVLPESQGQNLDLTVLYVPYAIPKTARVALSDLAHHQIVASGLSL